MPLPRAARRARNGRSACTAWMRGVPYGIALALAALLIYPTRRG